VGVDFNSCLANLYRDGSDSMGFHSDDEPELGPEPIIASISLGARRRFVLRHRVSRERWSWNLGAGDLLVMRNESQRDYAHAVPKTSRRIGPRMNLTFRQFHIRRSSLEISCDWPPKPRFGPRLVESKVISREFRLAVNIGPHF
jgi:2OG-Fe(II) oxygenase superfamily